MDDALQGDDTNDRYLRLHRDLALLLKKNRFVRKLTHTGLSRAEIHVLVETDALKTSSVSILQPYLGMDQSSISRLIKGLLKRKLLRSTPSEKDKRVKLLSLTARGSKVVGQIDIVAGDRFESFANNLTRSEADVLAVFFSDIADWYGQPTCERRPHESEVRMQQRRMSRAFGVLTPNVFHSELTSSQWHVFREICFSPYPLNPKRLSEGHDLPPNSLSIILDKLESKRYIRRASAAHDSRYRELIPTRTGKKFFLATESECVYELRALLQGRSEEELEHLSDILMRYVGSQTAQPEAPLFEKHTVKKIQGRRNRDKARAFAVTEIVQRRHAEHIPAMILGEDSVIYGLYDDEKDLVAIVEIQGDALSLCASSKRISRRNMYFFIEHVMKEVMHKEELDDIEVDFLPARQLLEQAVTLAPLM